MTLNLTSSIKQQIRKNQQEYLKAKAEYETIKEISEENKIKVLQNNVFLDDKGNRLFDCDYLITEEQFPLFMQLHFEENKKDGLPVYDMERVPEADASIKLKAIENELLKLQLLTIPRGLVEDIKKTHNHWKYREKAIDLIVRLQV